MQKLIDYINYEEEKKTKIADIFYKTGCYDFININNYTDINDKYVKNNTLKEDFYIENFYIITENDSYIIFEIVNSKSLNHLKEMTVDIKNKLKNTKTSIILWAILSETPNKGYATKNLLKLKEFSKEKEALTLIDTKTKELIKIVLKEEFNSSMFILKQESLDNYYKDTFI